MELLTFILVCFGCTNILAYGHIFDKIRPKPRFFHCPMCLGFWVGVMFSLLLETPVKIDEFPLLEWIVGLNSYMKDGIEAFACGCLSSGTSYILAMIVSDGGIQYETKNRKILDKEI